MKAETIEKFLKALGVHNCADNGEWVSSTCPLAPFFHASGVDSHPSFGITVVPGGHSNFNCFTCLSGSLQTLIGTIEMQLANRPELVHRYDLKSARAYLDGEEELVEPLPGYAEFTPGKHAEFYEWPQWFLDQFKPWYESPLAAGYLKMRGVPPDIANLMELRFDLKREMLVAPYRNLFGKLAGARGRAVRPDVPKHQKHHDYTCNGMNNADMVWYNEQALTLDRPVVVVEGQFDALRVMQVWPAVVAGLSAKVTPFKLRRLEPCQHIAFMLDNDEAGNMAYEKMRDRLEGMGPIISRIEYPKEYKDPGSVPLAELKVGLSALHDL